MALTGVEPVAVVVSDRRGARAWTRGVRRLAEAHVLPDAGHGIDGGSGRPTTRLHHRAMGGATDPSPAGVTLRTDGSRAPYGRLRASGVRRLSDRKREARGDWPAALASPDGNEFGLKQPARGEGGEG